MSEKAKPINDEELHAYVDGRLDTARVAEIEAWLATNPGAAARVESWRGQNRALRAMFDPMLDESVPARLTDTLRRSRRPAPWRVAAAVAWFALGGVAGYALHERTMPPAASMLFAERATVAHVVYAAEVLHPVEVTAEQEQHLVQWLSKRLGRDLRTPDLSTLGYQLVGGRLLPGDSGPAAQFMYQDAVGARLTLYVTSAGEGAGASAFRFHEERGARAFYWVDRDLGFALVGDVDRERLLDAAHVAYRALDL
jgi:anti-sigma factor RsiW